MTDERGWIRRKTAGQFQHSQGTGSWCHRPNEEHVLSHRNRSHVGDIWACPECGKVWVAVLRPSLLDAVPHWSVKWKPMCKWRARSYRDYAIRIAPPPQKEGER